MSATATLSTVADRVAAGAAWLDDHQPGWVDRIDAAQLDLEDCKECVLGQLFGDFAVAVRHQFGNDDEMVSRLGFEIPVSVMGRGDVSGRYAELTETWRELIAAERAGGEA